MILANYPGHFLALLILVALSGFLLWTHRGAELRQRRWATIALYLVNVTVAITLVLLIWDPSSRMAGASQVQNDVLVFVDTSESMAVADDRDGSTRLDRSAARVAALFPEDNRIQPRVQLMGFDAGTYACASIADLTRWGSSSNLNGVLTKVARELDRPTPTRPAGTLAGILILTDGQADQKTLAHYPNLEEAGIPIALVGVGTQSTVSDVAVTHLEAPLRATVNGNYAIRVAVAGEVTDDNALELQIEQNDQPVRTISLTAEDLQNERSFDIDLLAQTRGTDRIAAFIAPRPNEPNQRNNRREAITAIMEEPRLRTLLYSQNISPDVGRVRSALARIQKVTLDARIDALRTDVNARRTPGLTERDRPDFPESVEALMEFDLVIIGPCDPSTFSKAQSNALFTFVSERGGGLLLLPGTLGFDLGTARDEAMRALFPAEVALFPSNYEDKHGDALLTDVGARLNLIPANMMETIPVDLQPAYLAMAKPAATTVAAIDQEPILCIQRVGRGYTALLNLKGLFRLYRENENGGPLKSILSGLVTYLGLAPQEESRLELYAERVPQQPGQVRFQASVQSESYGPQANANVLLTVEGQTLPMHSLGDGTYDATTHLDALENTLATVEAVAGGTYIGERTVALTLPRQRHEMDSTQPDHLFLQNLADQVGASYYSLESLPDTWASALPATTAIPSSGKPTSIWRTWVIFTVLCAALTINWFARRMVGLL